MLLDRSGRRGIILSACWWFSHFDRVTLGFSFSIFFLWPIIFRFDNRQLPLQQAVLLRCLGCYLPWWLKYY